MTTRQERVDQAIELITGACNEIDYLRKENDRLKRENYWLDDAMHCTGWFIEQLEKSVVPFNRSTAERVPTGGCGTQHLEAVNWMRTYQMERDRFDLAMRQIDALSNEKPRTPQVQL